MTVHVADMVKEASSTMGTGAVMLAGPDAGFVSFRSRFANGAQLFYCQRQRGGAWEVNTGTLTYGAPDSLSRDAVHDSSLGAGIPVNWAGGAREVYVCQPASQMVLIANLVGLYMAAANLLSEIAALGAGAQATARGNLGLGAAAVDAVVTVAHGGTGGATQAAARTGLGLGSAAVLTAGNAVGNVVQVLTGGKLPVLDASNLTNVPAGGSPSVPSGARLPFYMAAVPSGYTLVTGLNDMLISLTDASGANPAGGTTGNTGGWDNSWGIASASHVLTVSEIPAHHHAVNYDAVLVAAGGTPVLEPSSSSVSSLAAGSQDTGGGAGHSHTLSSTSQWRPPNARFLLGQKT